MAQTSIAVENPVEQQIISAPKVSKLKPVVISDDDKSTEKKGVPKIEETAVQMTVSQIKNSLPQEPEMNQALKEAMIKSYIAEIKANVG